MHELSWLNRLLPMSCVFCRLCPANAGICDDCRRDLPALGRSCARCAEPIRQAPADGLICARCQARPPPWAACRAALPYAWPVDVALQRLKYGRELSYAAAFGELLAQLVMQDFPEVDALCAVPLHRWRQLHRGFNQAEELCRPVRRRTTLPLISKVRRVRHTVPQSGLRRPARERNLRGAFRLTGRCEFRHPLLIDDIMTTGETCRQLARLLLERGAQDVSVLTVARAALGDHAGVPANV